MLGGFGILLKSILKRLKMNNKKRFLHYIHTEVRTGVCDRSLTSTRQFPISNWKQRSQKIWSQNNEKKKKFLGKTIRFFEWYFEHFEIFPF